MRCSHYYLQKYVLKLHIRFCELGSCVLISSLHRAATLCYHFQQGICVRYAILINHHSSVTSNLSTFMQIEFVIYLRISTIMSFLLYSVRSLREQVLTFLSCYLNCMFWQDNYEI